MGLFVANDSGTMNAKVGTGWKRGFLQRGIQIDTISPSEVLSHIEEFFGEHESMHLSLVQANGRFHPFGTNLGYSKSNSWASKLVLFGESAPPLITD